MLEFVSKPYWHIHHEVLMEFNTEPIENRIEYIKECKDSEEIPIRLQLLKPVQGNIPSAVVKARDAYFKAWDACDKANDAYDKAEYAYYKARAALDKANDARNKAWDAYDKAEYAYYKALNDHMPEIEKLHAKECPNCPWNGETIFPND